MKFQLPIRRVGDLQAILDAARTVKLLTKSREQLKKNLNEMMDQRGGNTHLWRALCKLSTFAESLKHLPCIVEVVEGDQK